MQQNIIYQGNSVISVETLPEYSHPVVIKKPSKRHPSRRSLRSLEKEYEMTRALDAVEGVRKALGQQSLDNKPALVLEYIDGETLQDHIRSKKLNLRKKLELAVDSHPGKNSSTGCYPSGSQQQKYSHRKWAPVSSFNRFWCCFRHHRKCSSKSPARPDARNPALHLTGTDRENQPRCG